ncbi:MAG: hypothetical protein ACXVA9_00325 [Bdellovibrionales bacterium]
MNLLLSLSLFIVSLSAFAKGVDPAHQICKADRECRLVILACACIHNETCSGPDDKANGFVDGVNEGFVKLYSEMSKCSAQELHQCSMAGACAMRGAWVPECKAGKCTAVFKANR